MTGESSELERRTSGAAETILANARQRDVLRLLGLDPRQLESQALVAVAERYELDPLLREVELIATRGALRPYITRAGMLRIAHRSGLLDGIVTDELRRNSTGDGWTAYVSVWRKDASHPFRMGAQCKDTERQAREGYGPEQALARAMRRALIVAFAISTPDVDTRDDLAVSIPGATGSAGELASTSSDPADLELELDPETGELYSDEERAPFEEPLG